MDEAGVVAPEDDELLLPTGMSLMTHLRHGLPKLGAAGGSSGCGSGEKVGDGGAGEGQAQAAKGSQQEVPVMGPGAWGCGQGWADEGVELMEAGELMPEFADEVGVVGEPAARRTGDPATRKGDEMLQGGQHGGGEGAEGMGN